jgi:plasmid stabilization system protein ParE
LQSFAERAPVVPEFANPSIRELFVHGYRLIFRIDGKTIQILGVIHGARDMKSMWRSSEREP